MNKTQAFAILAPVPERHLISGKETIAKLIEESSDQIKVAFSSMDFEVFRKADELRGDKALDVFIYASHSADQSLKTFVTWRGLYTGFINSRNGRYPGSKKFCPPSTLTDRPTWAVFWEVQELEPLEKPIVIASLKGLGKKTNFTSRFTPEGPLLIEYL
ncbi:hypothetical protein NIES2119_24235 [[Phormidium ambiguum] IAM M-71]|uniref:Uncharacterized protein n=1 Tax=[Phormidium ambiguum] IAM M-71 TaxID=454136 RepID=A0A1U7I9I0_9CYAN|nr:hypothetical protein [Phormidium ambiguum]OKH33171.1 hypothetical protein NIES2119_24235 [Phormidium ambiguum IAM M-71]